MASIQSLADQLGVHPGDVQVIATEHGVHVDEFSDQDAADVRRVLDEHCVRSVPEVWWPGSDPDAGSGATKMR